MSTPTLLRGLFLLQLPHESQLLASAGSSSSLTQSSLDFVPPAFPLYIESTTIQTHCLQASADGPYLTLRSTTAVTGDPLWPNYTLLTALDRVRSPIEFNLPQMPFTPSSCNTKGHLGRGHKAHFAIHFHGKSYSAESASPDRHGGASPIPVWGGCGDPNSKNNMACCNGDKNRRTTSCLLMDCLSILSCKTSKIDKASSSVYHGRIR